MLADYRDRDAMGLTQWIASGAVSASEVTTAALGVLRDLNPRINAVVEVAEKGAQSQLARGLPPGPLHGVPVLLKDLGCPAIGTRSTYGSALFADCQPWTHDCRYVQKLKAAGAVVLGRTNSCEFGISLITEPHAFGPTHNPNAHGISVGGSSGGSAAAVAAGIVPIAHATDGCGSIRVPASHCGVFGLKASRGRVSFAPDMGESWCGMSVMGGVTRTVRDTALLLDVVSGYEPGDPHSHGRTFRSFVDELATPPPRLRIGVVLDGVAVDPDVRLAVEAAAALCESQGHQVEPARLSVDLEEAIGHFIVIWAAQLWSLVEPCYRALGLEPDGSRMEPISWALARRAHEHSAIQHLAAIRYLHRIGRELAGMSRDVDVLLTPVAAGTAQPLGVLRTDHEDLSAYMRKLFELFPFTVAFNVSGWPAMSVPMLRTRSGVPVGVQFAAPLGEDALLLRLARQIEIARPWIVG